jgi:MFS family permease
MPSPLPGRVRQLGWISFFADVASEMAYPVLPLFLSQTLKAPAIALGAVEGVSEAIVSFMKGWSGWHSDRRGRRVPYIRWGYGLSAAGKPLLALAASWPLVFVGRVLDRFGKGIRTTARDALLAESVERDSYGRAFGFHRAMDTAGAFVGVVAALALMYFLPGQYRLIFLLALVPGAISVWLTLALREQVPDSGVYVENDAGPSSTEADSRLSPAYWRAVLVFLVFALANSSDTFLLLRAKELGFSDLLVVLAYASYNVTYALSSYPAGRLSDRFGRWPILGIGWALFAAVYLGFALGSAAMLWLLFGLYGLYVGLTQGVGKALVADLAPRSSLGTAMGLFAMLSGLATLVASLLTGVIWDRVSPSAALTTCAGLAGLAIVLIPMTIPLGRKRA